MARHRLASSRRRSPVMVASVVAPAAVFFAVAGSADAVATRVEANKDVGDGAPCCVAVTAAAPASPSWALSDVSPGPDETVSASRASRWRVVNQNAPRVLLVGVAPERGLQVKTILAARSISAAFPEVKNIGGVRPDSKPWHPNGLALDVMIPNPSSAQGIALGNEIVAFALKNATRFSLQDAIWRGTYYTPSGPSGSGYGHYDHVHITTHGGGYPTGGEVYVR
ncbi:hypothetical protein [Mycobacterium sp.]|uniref:hypothetical protein n=1 Tax=Mycobacterium sp. TaxID=1785 RepID=UPI003C7472BB